jgi:hypothetical protein
LRGFQLRGPVRLPDRELTAFYCRVGCVARFLTLVDAHQPFGHAQVVNGLGDAEQGCDHDHSARCALEECSRALVLQDFPANIIIQIARVLVYYFLVNYWGKTVAKSSFWQEQFKSKFKNFYWIKLAVYSQHPQPIEFQYKISLTC